MAREPLSVVVTTLDNAATLPRLLSSVRFADEILIVDSGSRDGTLALAEAAGCRVLHKEFAGYGPQKAWAISQASHRLVLLLDADEWLPEDCQTEIVALLAALGQGGERLAGWRLRRRERVFWRYQHPWTRMNRFLRLVDRDRCRMSDSTVHATPEVDGPIGDLRAAFCHDGEPDIHTKVAKINHYSTGLVADKLARRSRFAKLRCLVYPPLFFLRLYVFKRGFLDGWAGFVAAVIGAFYVFLKYAKLDEARRRPA
jgi:glycosyltransferase involved in cell wall biosynthesis